MLKEPATNIVSKPRHCMVVHAYYPLCETRVERESLVLTTHGIEVDVICLQSRGEPSEEIVEGVHVYRMPVKRIKNKGTINQLLEYLAFFIFAMFKLISLHLKNHYKVIQVHNLPDWLVFVGMIPKLFGARVILDLHDLMPEFYAARFNSSFNSWPVRLLCWQERLSCWFANHVITVSEGWREKLIERGVPACKISVVMNVADSRIFFYSNQKEFRSNHNSDLKLLYHGNLTHRYGVDLAIRALGITLKNIPGIHLHIHGWGDAHQSLINLTSDLGLEKYVSFTIPNLSTSELPNLIRQADVCLVPYRQDVFTNGILPTKLMEYAALGMPVIAARTTTIQAYFKDTNVEFFEPGDVDDLVRCIRKLYHNPERLAELTLGSQKFNQRYNWSKLGEDYVLLIDRLRAGNPIVLE